MDMGRHATDRRSAVSKTAYYKEGQNHNTVNKDQCLKSRSWG